MKNFPVVEETEETVVAEKPAMGGGIRIPIPEGFEIPQGKKDGDDIEIIAKVKKFGNQLEVHELNCIKVSNAEEEAMEEKIDADEAADKESAMMAEEDGDEQFASELSSAIRQMP